MESYRFWCSGFCIFLMCYLIGGIPFGYLIGKFNGLDIRRHGSHNIGATNIRRVLGGDWGTVCFALDFLKGLIPVVYLGAVLGAEWSVGFEWGEIFAVVGTVLGHIFPWTLRFKGGKGVATSLGAVLGVAFWPVLWCALVWYLTFLKTRIVAIASIAAALTMPLVGLLMCFLRLGRIHGPAVILMLVLSGLIIYRHKDNILRLRAGSENAFRKPPRAAGGRRVK